MHTNDFQANDAVATLACEAGGRDTAAAHQGFLVAGRA